jgi:methionyl-tRNA formyltransferase
LNIVFLGNHEVGIRALKAIRPLANIALVVAHPPDPEDGVRYPSLFDYALNNGLRAIRGTPTDQDLENCIWAARPDLIWITDYRYVLPRSVIDLARLGAVNLHPSLLPKYRGRAPINWAILNGEKFLGLTAHFLDEGLDSGDVILQETFELHEDQDVGDALRILYPVYTRVCTQVMKYFLMGDVPRCPQDHSQATVFPRRTPDDGRIHWDRPVKGVLNLIRAVARPYPGAFTFHREKKMVVHAASLYSEGVKPGSLGEVLRVGENGFVIRASGGAILVHEAEMEETGVPMQLGKGDILKS